MKKVALVLSGGGARGIAHIGAIKVLEQNGFRITSIAGTSMGALVGGIYATGQLSEFEEWICSIDLRELFRLTDFSLSRQGFVKGKKVFDKMKEIVPDRNIEDLTVPFSAVATDIIEGTEVVFTEGDLYEAIRASISVPTVFQPFVTGEKYLIDGGILNPLPVDRIKRSGDDLLVVVDVNAFMPCEKKGEEETEAFGGRYFRKVMRIKDKLGNFVPVKKPGKIGLFNLTNRSLGLMMRRITDLTLEKQHPDLLVSISRDSFSFFDFYKAREIIAEGEKATLEALKKTSLTA